MHLKALFSYVKPSFSRLSFKMHRGRLSRALCSFPRLSLPMALVGTVTVLYFPEAVGWVPGRGMFLTGLVAISSAGEEEEGNGCELHK